MKKSFFLVLSLFAVLFFCCNDEKEDVDKITLTVASETASCNLVGEYECFFVKYGQKNEWVIFSQKIKGFDYEKGKEYVITVRIEKRKESLQDVSDNIYVLDEIISVVEKDSEDLPE